MGNNFAEVTIRHSWLLAVFSIIPIVLGVALYDWLVQDGAWLPFFTLSSLLLPAYLLVFELPHIIASFLGFFDRGYIRFYARRFLIGLPLLLSAFGLLVWWNIEFAIMVYLSATMYHVMRQQTGVSLLLRVPRNRWWHWWSWSLVVASTVLFIVLVYPSVFPSDVLPALVYGSYAVVLFALICSVKLFLDTPTRVGKQYVVATACLVLAAIFLLSIQYVFLAVFVIRFVHDVTAFIFYIVHEMNRNREHVYNVLYRLLPLLPLSLVVLVPLVAITIGLTMRTMISDTYILFVIVMLLGFMHYYLESVMWKRDSLHRQHISIERA